MNRLKGLYDNDVMDGMIKKFGYSNKLAVPKIEKVIVNMGLGEAKENAKVIENATNDMSIITGQKPIVTKAKKSVSAFKLRAGMPIGCKVTLRGDKMYSFIDRLINVAIPRVRDFRGVSSEA